MLHCTARECVCVCVCSFIHLSRQLTNRNGLAELWARSCILMWSAAFLRRLYFRNLLELQGQISYTSSLHSITRWLIWTENLSQFMFQIEMFTILMDSSELVIYSSNICCPNWWRIQRNMEVFMVPTPLCLKSHLILSQNASCMHIILL
jgi:hypothetical protein